MTLFFFIFGLLVGSFLNVVVYRLGTGFSIISGRSKCLSCGKILHWYELLPLVSFLFLLGRCSKCHTKISWQYPVVELLLGITFLLLYQEFFAGVWSLYFFSSFFLYAVIFSLLITIGVYDLRHKIIPNALVYSLILLGVLVAYLRASSNPVSLFLLPDLFVGPIFFLSFASLWYFSKGRAMGFGDAKLVLALGLILGASSGLSAVVLAFWIGAIYGIFGMLISKFGEKLPLSLSTLKALFGFPKRLTMKSEVPFAPFLIFGFYIAFFSHLDLFSLTAYFDLFS
ncbi:MAG: prepilin peptidase [Patescibacteria group bacterium]